jgi:hypothetical protein
MRLVNLIDNLATLEHDVESLAFEVHACWLRHRQSEGWMLGPPYLAQKSSPYLKPLAQFSSYELDREVQLALNDLRGIAKAIGTLDRSDAVPRTLKAQTASGVLHSLRLNNGFVEKAAINIHEGWRNANRKLRMNLTDIRLNQPFHQLSTENRRITMANVQADIEAIAKLIDKFDNSPAATASRGRRPQACSRRNTFRNVYSRQKLLNLPGASAVFGSVPEKILWGRRRGV